MRSSHGCTSARVEPGDAHVLCKREVGDQRRVLEHRGDPGGHRVGGLTRAARRPLTAIVPESAGKTPERILTRVLLPAPFAPSRAWISPALDRRGRPSEARQPVRTAWRYRWPQQGAVAGSSRQILGIGECRAPAGARPLGSGQAQITRRGLCRPRPCLPCSGRTARSPCRRTNRRSDRRRTRLRGRLAR